jgi:Methanol-cobalamin methyltransferase B subunit.
LKPDIAFEISKEIVKTQDPFIRTLNTAKLTIEILQRAVKNKELTLEEREINWLTILESQVEDITEDEEAFIAEMKEEVDISKYNPSEYGI